MTELLKNLSFKKHLANTIPFDTLYTELNKRVEQGYISVSKKDNLELYNYTNTTTFEKKWDIYTLLSRGLILDAKNKKIVSYCLHKFFNYQEYPEIPALPFTILDKLDGSCVMIWYHNNEWNCSTRGSFNSIQALQAKYFLDMRLNTDHLIPGYTYIAEIIYPENRIVIKYDFEGLFLLTAFDENGVEVDDVKALTDDVGFYYPKEFHYSSITELLELSEKHNEKQVDEEGFVVKFSNGFRTKIKYADYITLHKMIANCSPLSVWESLKNNVDVSEMKKVLPEEFRNDIEKMEKIFSDIYNKLMGELVLWNEKTKELSDKEVGILVQTSKEVPEIVKKFIFGYRKNKFVDEVVKIGRIRNAFFDNFRPTNNILEGYEPNSSMHNFVEKD